MSLNAFYDLPDIERQWREEQHAEQAGRCPHCRRPRSECSEPEKLWYPHREVCYATRERAAADAAYADLHKDRPWHDGTYTRWSKERSDSFPYRFDHGVTVGVADQNLAPHDLFTTQENAALTLPEQLAPDEDGGGDG